MHISRCSLQRPSEDDGGVDVQNTDARTEPGRAVKRAVDWLICQGCGWMLYAKRLIRNLSLAGPVRIPGESRRQDDQHVAVYRRGQGSGQLSRRPLTVRRGTTMISEGTHAQPTGAIEQNSRRLQQVEISSLSPIPPRWRFLEGVVRVLRRIHTPSGSRCSFCEVRIVQQPVIYRAPLTFGQLSLWRSIQGLPPEVCNLPQLWTLPTGTSLASVERALETLEDRHESLRTRYEADGVQSLTQAVWDSAAVSLDVVEAGGDGSGEGAAAVAEKLGAAPFDLAVDRPWRACTVTCGGVASRLAICIHHIAVDAWAINQLNEEFLALLDGRSLPDTAPNPRDLAADQWSAARQGRRKSARRYWQEIFEAAPAMEREDAAEA